MGCDIHLFTEKKVNNEWVHADELRKNQYYDPNDPDVDYEKEFESSHIYGRRDYGLFAVLANVRNYGPFTPIAEPKGLPDNVSTFVKQTSDDYGRDGHSHSWLTIEEMKNFLYQDPQKQIENLLKGELSHNLPNEVWASVDRLIKKMEVHMPGRPEDGRIVFWFDN